MVVYRNLTDIRKVPNSVLTMGTFDGLHRGHQEVVRNVIIQARALNLPAVLVTYDPHPRYLLDTGKDPLPMLMSIDRKLQMLKELGLDIVLVVPFTKAISLMTAEDYIRNIVIKNFNPSHLVIGYDHHFGHSREGSPEFLERLCQNLDIDLTVESPVSDETAVISSTRIRQLIADGFVRRASFELGWVYGFEASVVHGAGRGRTLNFPTANFIPLDPHQLLPRRGVYCTRGRVHGQQLYGMCNLGIRPTFDDNDFVMEVHLFNESPDDLYQQQITIEFLERIRDEKKFNSSEELIRQLKLDKQQCMTIIKKYM